MAADSVSHSLPETASVIESLLELVAGAYDDKGRPFLGLRVITDAKAIIADAKAHPSDLNGAMRRHTFRS